MKISFSPSFSEFNEKFTKEIIYKLEPKRTLTKKQKNITRKIKTKMENMKNSNII